MTVLQINDILHWIALGITMLGVAFIFHNVHAPQNSFHAD